MKAEDVIKVINDFHEKFEKCNNCDFFRYDKNEGRYVCKLKEKDCIQGGEKLPR